jgi:chorismate mutase
MSEAEPADELASLRAEMTPATKELALAFLKRCKIADAIGAVKAQIGITQVRDPEREQEMQEHVAGLNDGTVPDDILRSFMQTVMDLSCEIQVRQTGLPLGSPGGEFPTTPPIDKIPLIRRSGW